MGSFKIDVFLHHLELLSKNDDLAVKFHIAHLFEVQGKVKGAKERYELLLRDKSIDASLRADIFRQLGKVKIGSSSFHFAHRHVLQVGCTIVTRFLVTKVSEYRLLYTAFKEQ